jgi:hypothetical protein
MHGNYEYNILQGSFKLSRLQATMIFVIWQVRCCRIFREEYKEPQQLELEIIQEFRDWFASDDG